MQELLDVHKSKENNVVSIELQAYGDFHNRKKNRSGIINVMIIGL